MLADQLQNSHLDIPKIDTEQNMVHNLLVDQTEFDLDLKMVLTIKVKLLYLSKIAITLLLICRLELSWTIMNTYDLT